jgi:hypothetical protein
MYVENLVLEENASGAVSDAMVWIAGWSGPIGYVLTAVFLFLLFPTGHLLSRRWLPVAWLAAISFGTLVLGSALGRLELDDYPLTNPIGFGGDIAQVLDVLRGASWIGILLSIVLAAISMTIRFKRSRGVVRQQLKWVALAGIVLLFASLSWSISETLGAALTGIGFLAVPIAVGIAILRHRLYDIDVIINRTLVYAILTTLLGATYFAVVTGASSLAGDSSIYVAGATLVVAGLFQPLRRTIQAFIDRSFYRTKYDAIRTIDSFALTLRHEIDVEMLTRELISVVGRTMQPAFVTLWLQGEQPTAEQIKR